MDKNFKRNVWIGVAVIVGSITLFAVASTLLSENMAGKTGKIVADRLLISKRAELLSNLADIKRLSPEASLYKQKMDLLLPSQEQLLNFPQVLNNLASAHKISFNFSFRGSPTLPQGNNPGTTNLSMDLGGSLANLIFFLNDIEAKTTRFIMSVDNFDLANVGADYRLTIQGRAFFQ